jgi:hypothetical protein
MKTLLLFISGILLLSGCGIFNTCNEIHIRGEITSISRYGDTTSILIEGELEKDTAYDKASASVSSKTRIIDKRGGQETKTDAGILETGLTVEACFEGAVAESYPVQATAGSVFVID